MNVFIVEEPDYDGSHIHGVFSTREKAEEYVLTAKSECVGYEPLLNKYSTVDNYIYEYELQ